MNRHTNQPGAWPRPGGIESTRSQRGFAPDDPEIAALNAAVQQFFPGLVPPSGLPDKLFGASFCFPTKTTEEIPLINTGTEKQNVVIVSPFPAYAISWGTSYGSGVINAVATTADAAYTDIQANCTYIRPVAMWVVARCLDTAADMQMDLVSYNGTVANLTGTNFQAFRNVPVAQRYTMQPGGTSNVKVFRWIASQQADQTYEAPTYTHTPPDTVTWLTARGEGILSIERYTIYQVQPTRGAQQYMPVKQTTADPAVFARASQMLLTHISEEPEVMADPTKSQARAPGLIAKVARSVLSGVSKASHFVSKLGKAVPLVGNVLSAIGSVASIFGAEYDELDVYLRRTLAMSPREIALLERWERSLGREPTLAASLRRFRAEVQLSYVKEQVGRPATPTLLVRRANGHVDSLALACSPAAAPDGLLRDYYEQEEVKVVERSRRAPEPQLRYGVDWVYVGPASQEEGAPGQRGPAQVAPPVEGTADTTVDSAGNVRRAAMQPPQPRPAR